MNIERKMNKKSPFGTGALTPDNMRAPRKNQLPFNSSQTRLPLQTSNSVANYNSNMTKQFSAPIDSLDQVKSYVTNKRQNFRRIIAEKTLTYDNNQNSPLKKHGYSQGQHKTLYQGFLVGHLPSNSFDNFTEAKEEKVKANVKGGSSPSNAKKLLDPDSLKRALQ